MRLILFLVKLSNISKTNARVSSGVPNSEKQMKRPSAFYCLEMFGTPDETEARVFEMTSQPKQ